MPSPSIKPIVEALIILSATKGRDRASQRFVVAIAIRLTESKVSAQHWQ
jgi:hypothetical protein